MAINLAQLLNPAKKRSDDNLLVKKDELVPMPDSTIDPSLLSKREPLLPVGNKYKPRMMPTNPDPSDMRRFVPDLQAPTKLDYLKEDIEDLETNPVEDNDKGVWGRIKEALGNALYGMGEYARQNQGNLTWQGFVGGAGGGVGGGLIDPTWDETRKRDKELEELYGQLGRLTQTQKAEADAIYQGMEQQRKNRELQIKEKQADADIYDKTNKAPDVKSINGESFIWNGAQRRYEPTSGLPGEAMTDYTANGVKYRIPVKEAAKYQTEITAAEGERNFELEKQGRDIRSREKMQDKELKLKRALAKEDSDTRLTIAELDRVTRKIERAEDGNEKQQLLVLKAELDQKLATHKANLMLLNNGQMPSLAGVE